MFFYLKASSKDKKVLDNFIKYLSRLEASPLVLKHFSKQNKRKFITILKSPHVNKTAQEQFEFRFYSKQFLVNSFRPFTFLLTLKKIKNLSFPGLDLKIKGLFDISKCQKKVLDVIDLDNVIIRKTVNPIQDKQKIEKKAEQRYVQLFDCYGEICLKHAFYLKK